jgi:hypothetical protein
LGCLTGGAAGAGELGVDFEDVAVEEEIVMAPLPDEGGMICLGVGVGAGADFEERGVLAVEGLAGGGLMMISS